MTRDSLPDPSRDDRLPAERLIRLAELFPIKRRLPRKIVTWACCLFVALSTLTLCASLFSEQAAAVIEIWLDRIAKNAP